MNKKRIYVAGVNGVVAIFTEHIAGVSKCQLLKDKVEIYCQIYLSGGSVVYSQENYSEVLRMIDNE